MIEMKKLIILFYVIMSFSPLTPSGRSHADSLIVMLDRAIEDRGVYVERRSDAIKQLKQQRDNALSLDEIYLLNEQIADSYNAFICDSAMRYIVENIAIAKDLGDNERLINSKLRLTGSYSASGLFLLAEELFGQINFNSLKGYQKSVYCWNKIKYYEQLQKYSNNKRLTDEYAIKIDNVRDTLMSGLSINSDLYKTEKIFKLQHAKRYNEALDLSLAQFQKTEIDTHGYAMKSMLIANLYRSLGNRELENHYLKYIQN